MTGFLNQLIETTFPELKNFYNTEQYKLSLEILHEKNILGKTVEEMAELLNLSKDEYLTFEDGYDSKTIEEYREILNKIKSYNSSSSEMLDITRESNTTIIIHSLFPDQTQYVNILENSTDSAKRSYSVNTMDIYRNRDTPSPNPISVFIEETINTSNSFRNLILETPKEYNSNDYILHERTEEFAF